MRRGGAALAALLALASCDAPAPPSPQRSFGPPPRDPGAVAYVGDVAIPGDRVALIAAAQRVPIAEARDLAVRDALFSLEARSRGIDADREIELQTSALLARVLVEDINAAAAAEGPVTDAELDEVTARHWVELDRPEAARTAHAVVLLEKNASPAKRARALSVAEAIRKAVAPVAEAARTSAPPGDPRADDPAFPVLRQAVSTVPKDDFEVRVEALPPVVADGRTITGQGALEEAYAKAALGLERRGDVSSVAETSYGFHVLLLLERIPAQLVPREERRRLVREEVVTDRARRARDEVLADQRASVKIDRSLDALLAAVPVDQ
jgi:hypothetical protein